MFNLKPRESVYENLQTFAVVWFRSSGMLYRVSRQFVTDV